MDSQALALMAMVSFTGILVACVLAIESIAKHGSVRVAAAPVRVGWAWAWCPRGHAKMIVSSPKACPLCADAMECA